MAAIALGGQGGSGCAARPQATGGFAHRRAPHSLSGLGILAQFFSHGNQVAFAWSKAESAGDDVDIDLKQIGGEDPSG